jgi:hypothetical protein
VSARVHGGGGGAAGARLTVPLVLLLGGLAGCSYCQSLGDPGDAGVQQDGAGSSSLTGFLPGRTGHTATLLASGQVLIVGGSAALPAFLYDRATGTFTATGSLARPRSGHTATLLPSGQLLIVGGDGGDDPAVDTAELYDPASGTFSDTGSPASAPAGHAATLLPSGQVLIVGGYGHVDDGPDSYFATAQLYDPASGTFVPTGSMATARHLHTATLLASGQVLVAGGISEAGYERTAELYDPASGAFSPTGSLAAWHVYHSATLLRSGKVLIAGSGGTANEDGLGTHGYCELYDPATGSFAPTGVLEHGGRGPQATLLASGLVLVAGGGETEVASAELYDPETGAFAAATPLVVARRGHTATLLLSGEVLIAGGYGRDPNNGTLGDLYLAELYAPE